MNNHAIYLGQIGHQRFTPKTHGFGYRLSQWWFDLDDLDSASKTSRLLSIDGGFAAFMFRSSDYLRDESSASHPRLADKVRAKMSALAGRPLQGRVYLLGNVRCFGIYFSPLNCYYLADENGTFTHLLAEVSNTPWNERHYYLLALDQALEHEKSFHVSPFNPIEMDYRWQLRLPELREGAPLGVTIELWRKEKIFTASMNLKRLPLNRSNIRYVFNKTPWMTVKAVAGIYWQALRLALKRVPFYGHARRNINE
ncbi:MAG: DUF1365 domain-containing protein [Aliidiomarina sp.]|uniref:DUF1365 domain-containing protein n=1 Tax=Aliidiomarina sp. TaxID=1872439 RepID=UPI0025BED3F6|nr:DUF1365 domain-containing protein [Aliidiomarina sp.]MCH8500366.1 DUF1365 domain-containing protein [Aliidiomarina sp.]